MRRGVQMQVAWKDRGLAIRYYVSNCTTSKKSQLAWKYSVCFVLLFPALARLAHGMQPMNVWMPAQRSGPSPWHANDIAKPGSQEMKMETVPAALGPPCSPLLLQELAGEPRFIFLSIFSFPLYSPSPFLCANTSLALLLCGGCGFNLESLEAHIAAKFDCV